MNLNLENQKALVCGSSQGIGLAAAIELAALGASIVLLARNKSRLQVALEKLPNNGQQKHSILVADFDEPSQVEIVINSYIADNQSFSILINNTGGPAGGSIIEARIEDFFSTFQRHLVINQLLAQAVLPGMKALGYGRIINIISTSVKQPLDGLGISNTIRGAVASWAKTWANEVGQYGITVNNVLPGATNTQRLKEIITQRSQKQSISYHEISERMESTIPLGRFGRPSEIGAAIAFLATPTAAYINGINLVVDGGRTRSL